MTGKALETMLDEVHITVNKNTIPFETESPFITSGIRIGTPAVTSRGMKEKEMEIIADLITEVIENKENCFECVTSKVEKLLSDFPLYNNDIID